MALREMRDAYRAEKGVSHEWRYRSPVLFPREMIPAERIVDEAVVNMFVIQNTRLTGIPGVVLKNPDIRSVARRHLAGYQAPGDFRGKIVLEA